MSAPHVPGTRVHAAGLDLVHGYATGLPTVPGRLLQSERVVGEMFGDLDEDALVAKLAELRQEHRALDAEVRAAQVCGMTDQLKLVRQKRRKLMLKDMIFALEDRLNPDIIA